MQGTVLGVHFIWIDSKLTKIYRHTYIVYDAIFFEQLWGVVYHVTHHVENFPPHEYHYEVITQREVEVLHANAMGSL